MTEDKPNPIDWRTLSEQTGYRVLTFPSGETMSACAIAAVRIGEAAAGVPKYGHPAIPRRVIIDSTDITGRTLIAHHTITEDVDAVFEMATAAHRQWGGRGPDEPGNRRPVIDRAGLTYAMACHACTGGWTARGSLCRCVVEG